MCWDIMKEYEISLKMFDLHFVLKSENNLLRYLIN